MSGGRGLGLRVCGNGARTACIEAKRLVDVFLYRRGRLGRGGPVNQYRVEYSTNIKLNCSCCSYNTNTPGRHILFNMNLDQVTPTETISQTETRLSRRSAVSAATVHPTDADHIMNMSCIVCRISNTLHSCGYCNHPVCRECLVQNTNYCEKCIACNPALREAVVAIIAHTYNKNKNPCGCTIM